MCSYLCCHCVTDTRKLNCNSFKILLTLKNCFMYSATMIYFHWLIIEQPCKDLKQTLIQNNSSNFGNVDLYLEWILVGATENLAEASLIWGSSEILNDGFMYRRLMSPYLVADSFFLWRVSTRRIYFDLECTDNNYSLLLNSYKFSGSALILVYSSHETGGNHNKI